MRTARKFHPGGVTSLLVLVLALAAAGLATASSPAGAQQQAKQRATDMIVMAYDWSDSDRALGHRFLTISEPDSSNVRLLATGGSVLSFDVSRNGKKIAYVTGDALWSIGMNGKNDKKLLQMPEGITITTPTWSKNSKQIWFGSYGGTGGLRVHRLNVKTMKLTTDVIKSDTAIQVMKTFSMSPNGKYLLVVPTEQFRKDRGFPPLIYNIKTGAVTELPRGSIDEAAWTPNNDIVTQQVSAGFEYVDVPSMDSVTIYDQINNSFFLSAMDVSADGSSIIFHDRTFEGFHIIDIASGTRRPFTLYETESSFENLDYAGPGQIEWTKSKTARDPARCYGWVITKSSGDKSTTIRGTEGGDVIESGGGDDIIYALGGNDVVCGGDDGDDIIFGGHGNDFLNGDNGNDRIYGGPGDDIIWGDAGGDRLYGQGGDDLLFTDADDTAADGGPGRDNCRGDGC